MSLFGSFKKILSAAAPVIPGGGVVSTALGLIGGGNGGPNIANSLSKQVGCTILQKDANAARAAMARGIDPCTGQSRGPQPVLAPVSMAALRTPAAPPAVSFASLGAAPAVGMSALPAIARAGGGLLRTTTGRASGVILASGQRFSRAKAVALIRRVGMEVAAVALGITVVEAAELLLTQSRAGRRRRGITGAQLATTKRTICTLKRMTSQLGISRAAPRRKTTCR